MDMKQLRYFTAICEEGSISGAAKKLFVTQPPVSTQMRMLEEELGVTLFERGVRNIKLTEAGKSFYKRAVTVLELCSVAKEEAAGFSGDRFTCIRIGVVSSLVTRVTGEWMKEFCQAHPDVRFEITEGNTYQLLEKLNTDLLHFALVRTPFTRDGVESVLVQEEKIIAASVPGLFGREQPSMDLRDLSELPLILYRRWEKIICQAFEERNIAYRCAILCDDARTAVNSAKSGIGVAVIPASAADGYDLQRTDIRDLPLRSGIVMIRRKEAEFSGMAKAFMDHITEKYRNAK